VAGVAVAAAFVYRSGREVPSQLAARLYLWQRLKALGLAERVPAACVNELADRELARRSSAALTERLDALGDLVARHAAGAPLAPPLAAVAEILNRHGVARASSNASAAAATSADPRRD
jgi:hypothetical protein